MERCETRGEPARRAARLLAVVVLAGAVASCGGKSSKEMSGGSGTGAIPPVNAPRPGEVTSCPTIEGEYRCAFKTSCGSTGWGWAKVKQTGCDVEASLGLLGTLKGTLRGESASVTVTFAQPCTGSGSGTLTVTGSTISGTFAGASSGKDQRCCNPISGNFTLTKP